MMCRPAVCRWVLSGVIVTTATIFAVTLLSQRHQVGLNKAEVELGRPLTALYDLALHAANEPEASLKPSATVGDLLPALHPIPGVHTDPVEFVWRSIRLS